MYIHELEDWPRFRWDLEELAVGLAEVRHRQGKLLGRMQALGFPLRQEAVLETLTEDVVKSSEIEGEKYDAGVVRSSIARRLGMESGFAGGVDRDVEGVVEMMLDATGRWEAPLDAERLFGWHAALFPAGRSGMGRIRTGAWRDDSRGPMQVVSGRVGKERVHFEAPAAGRVEGEMRQFLNWFESGGEMDGVLKAGLAHLWFVTVHPFEDGNGRMARAIADLALARSEGSGQRFYSMSAQIRKEREEYYEELERAQKGTMDVTAWLGWFVECLGRAIESSEELLGSVLGKARFWEAHGGLPLGERQRRVLNRLLDGFVGKLTTSKYAALGKCSQDTAQRDLQKLMELGVVEKEAGGGRSTSYRLVGV